MITKACAEAEIPEGALKALYMWRHTDMEFICICIQYVFKSVSKKIISLCIDAVHMICLVCCSKETPFCEILCSLRVPKTVYVHVDGEIMRKGKFILFKFSQFRYLGLFFCVIGKWALLSCDNALIHNEMIILSSWDDMTMATLRSCMVQKIHLCNICCRRQTKQRRRRESRTAGVTAGEGILFMFSQHLLWTHIVHSLTAAHICCSIPLPLSCHMKTWGFSFEKGYQILSSRDF